jgi:hypothetical protein
VPDDDLSPPSNDSVPAASAQTEAAMPQSAAQELACFAVRTADCARGYHISQFRVLNLNSDIEDPCSKNLDV